MRLKTVGSVVLAAFTALSQVGCSSVGMHTNVGTGRVGGRVGPGGVSVDGGNRNGHVGARANSQEICVGGGARTAGGDFCIDPRALMNILGGNQQPQPEAPQGVPQRAVPPRSSAPTTGGY